MRHEQTFRDAKEIDITLLVSTGVYVLVDPISRNNMHSDTIIVILDSKSMDISTGVIALKNLCPPPFYGT